MNEYTPKPTWVLCIICGEPIVGDHIVGGKVRRGGTRCAHTECWEREQAELAKEVRPCPSRLKKK